ncbi:hypothetical protein [Salmonella phage NINP13076]|uniref:Uncharacterized protein n=1 Tax=Salmonella phage SalP219 TaxID=3158864 RepID=A0AAU7PIK8_9CAUD|nr:hypothetical protein [Salmonella phage NINP13076]
MKKVIFDNKKNTVTAEKVGEYIELTDLYSDAPIRLSPAEYRDKELLKHVVAMEFEGFSYLFPFPDDFDHDGLYGV